MAVAFFFFVVVVLITFLFFFFRKWCYGIPLLWNTTSFLFFLLFAAQVGVNDKLHGNEHAKK